MKKIISQNAIIMIVAFNFIQFTGFSQSVHMRPFAIASVSQQGAAKNEIGVGGDITADIFEHKFSVGASMSGGTFFPYQTSIKTMDLKKDSMIWRTTNAPTIQAIFAINIPKGDNEERINPFWGPVAGIKLGEAIPDLNHSMTGMMTLFLQLNYSKQMGTDENKWYLGFFVQPSFNFLYTSTPYSSSPLWVGTVNAGIHLGLGMAEE